MIIIATIIWNASYQQQQHDTEENWQKAVNFVPPSGMLIIYDPDATHDEHRMKIGDGVTNVNSLPFFAADATTIDAITSEEIDEICV